MPQMWEKRKSKKLDSTEGNKDINVKTVDATIPEQNMDTQTK